jgi:hypothetical protein
MLIEGSTSSEAVTMTRKCHGSSTIAIFVSFSFFSSGVIEHHYECYFGRVSLVQVRFIPVIVWLPILVDSETALP